MTDDVARQLEVIRRGVEQVVPEEELVSKLERSIRSGRPLRIKYGIDPTGIDVHLGHTVPLRKLRQFQELGHQAVIIIGNYTALVGDPSGRDETRARLDREQVEANAETYLAQVGRIIDLERAEVVRNGDWFGKLTFLDVLELTSRMTVARMLERDDFSKRFKAGAPIYLHECLYPLMQGRDSVEVRADVELGGSEQLFSLMVARELQKDAGQEPQVAITLPILKGLDGVRRMGKSLKNYIGVADPPGEMFGKLMSIPDTIMEEDFRLLTDRPLNAIAVLCDPARTHPRQAKALLARDVVGQYYGPEAAEFAAAEFDRRFSGGRKQDPSEIPLVELPAAQLSPGGTLGIAKLLCLAGLVPSTSEGRRLVQQGGVTLGEERSKVTDPKAEVPVADGLVVRVGSRKVVRVAVKSP